MADDPFKLPARAFSQDVLSGIVDRQLMNKYGIDSSVDLYRAFKRLIMMGIIEPDERRYRLPEGCRAKWNRYDPPAPSKEESSRLLRVI
jgi:hypothetical protein